MKPKLSQHLVVNLLNKQDTNKTKFYRNFNPAGLPAGHHDASSLFVVQSRVLFVGKIFKQHQHKHTHTEL